MFLKQLSPNSSEPHSNQQQISSSHNQPNSPTSSQKKIRTSQPRPPASNAPNQTKRTQTRGRQRQREKPKQPEKEESGENKRVKINKDVLHSVTLTGLRTGLLVQTSPAKTETHTLTLLLAASTKYTQEPWCYSDVHWAAVKILTGKPKHSNLKITWDQPTRDVKKHTEVWCYSVGRVCFIHGEQKKAVVKPEI